MVVGRGHGGGQVGRGRRSTEHGGSSIAPPASEKTEAEKVKSDAACIRGSYRYRNPSPAFANREPERYRRGCAASSSAASSSSGSRSRQRPPTALVVKMEDAEPEPEPRRLPHFAPGDYLNDEQFELLLPQLGVNEGLAPDKAAEWRHIAVEQNHVFVDLVSDEE